MILKMDRFQLVIPQVMSNNKGKVLNPSFEPLKQANTFSSEIQKIQTDFNLKKQNKGLFKVHTANEWLAQAKNRPIPKELFGKLWFENELCILFADTNLGKSILAVQIGNSISQGKPIEGFSFNALKQKVLYFDFELSDKQFENRYSKDFKDHYNFDDDFIRIEINPNAEYNENTNFETYLNESLEKCIVDTNAKILIIDNITYLKNETEKSKNALPLMKHLKALKSQYELSILVLAHTPKRDLSKPITRNDLAGSKMLMNFADSSLAIGESNKDKQLRYIKQIKARSTEIMYDANHVAICQIHKHHNFLQFEFLDVGIEQEHLKIITKKNTQENILEAKELKEQGYSNIKIAKEFVVSEGAVRKWLKKDTENE